MYCVRVNCPRLVYTFGSTHGLDRKEKDGLREGRQRGHESIFMVRGEFCGVNWMPMSAVAVATSAAAPLLSQRSFLMFLKRWQSLKIRIDF